MVASDWQWTMVTSVLCGTDARYRQAIKVSNTIISKKNNNANKRPRILFPQTSDPTDWLTQPKSTTAVDSGCCHLPTDGRVGPSALSLFLLERHETRGVGRALSVHVRERAGAAGARRTGPARQRVRPAGDDGQAAGVARLDGRRQSLIEVDLLGVDVGRGRHVARQTLQTTPRPHLPTSSQQPAHTQPPIPLGTGNKYLPTASQHPAHTQPPIPRRTRNKNFPPPHLLSIASSISPPTATQPLL